MHCASVQSSENQLQEEEEEGLERLRDVLERKLRGEYGRNSGDWFVGFVQAPEAGEPFGRERIITWRNLGVRNRFGGRVQIQRSIGGVNLLLASDCNDLRCYTFKDAFGDV